MAKKRLYKVEEIDALNERLLEFTKKPAVIELDTLAAIKKMKSTITKLLNLGNSTKRVAEILNELGFEITESTLKKYLIDSKPRNTRPKKVNTSSPNNLGSGFAIREDSENL